MYIYKILGPKRIDGVAMACILQQSALPKSVCLAARFVNLGCWQGLGFGSG